ncbi:decapping and exoribonuclease protein-like [Saccoglossus kowalevskii]|uniref:Decapping nuclease n=1 Tax=Saccoglossus kowalevskii TaxID=10224 RepID=A0ABM0MJX3_SACKO|nr:PREDICTED: decapping and exoribonuclease protein-like [Saccoglossus kowalevskii]
MKRRTDDTDATSKRQKVNREPVSYSPKTLQSNPALYDGNFPYFRQPREIGCFSLDIDREFHNDARQLRYYFPPDDTKRVKFDLTKGYEKYIKRDDDVKERLDILLKWVLANREKFNLHKKPETKEEIHTQKDGNLHTDFITWRGHLTKILCTPYENREDWKMAVSLFNGTYYISEVETEESRDRRKNMTSAHKEMTYWGYKFEQYVVSADGHTPPSTEDTVNNIEGYCTVVRTRLNENSLVFSGEVDCCRGDNTKPSKNYVELKTSREIYTDRQYRNFKRFKLIKWWAQSFLPGLPTIVAGFRDDDGVVTKLETYETMKIPDLVKDDPYMWNPSVCVNFCDKFLCFVKQVVQKDDPRCVYLFEWNPSSKRIIYTVHEDDQQTFLPDWFLEEMQK